MPGLWKNGCDQRLATKGPAVIARLDRESAASLGSACHEMPSFCFAIATFAGTSTNSYPFSKSLVV